MMPTWETIDWEALDRLRTGFLAAEPSRRAYWKSPSDLANYDFTFGTRIGWKWDAVLKGLKGQGWTPPGGPVVDWGCGSGVAGRKVVEAFGEGAFTQLVCHDRSRIAMEFAVGKAQWEFPGLAVEVASGGDDGLGGHARIGTLVISHVLNELPPPERKSLLRAIRRAEAVVWVEPGTHGDSHALIEFRELLKAEMGVVAPCPHGGTCGLALLGKTPHWCHFFASPPSEVFSDSGWVRFAQRAGIDLRSLPYSYLVLDRRGGKPPGGTQVRIVGWPRHYKGYVRVFACDSEGLREVTLQERDHPGLFKELRDGPRGCLLEVVMEGAKVREARWLPGT
jgi:SAM-dependent methyltransferase